MIVKRKQIKIYDTVIKLNTKETECLLNALENRLKTEGMTANELEFFTRLHDSIKAENMPKFKTRD